MNLGTHLSIFFILLCLLSNAQPVNDDCTNPIDLSNEQWYSGDNINATFDCTADHRTGHCGSPSGCIDGYEYTNSTDMCCAIEGIESSVWFTFSIPEYDTVYVDFRNIICDPVEFCIIPPNIGCFTTALQGFVLRRVSLPDLPCLSPCRDTTKACFNSDNTSDINGQMEVYANANQTYYIQIDTKKNSNQDCTPTADQCVPSSTCHSECTFDIRIRRKNGFLKQNYFTISKSTEGVNISWKPNAENLYIINRERIDKNEPQIQICSGENHRKENSCFDNNIKSNGIYKYTLKTSEDGKNYKKVKSKIINYDLYDKTKFHFFPNPSNDIINIDVLNPKSDPYELKLYSLDGKLLHNIHSSSFRSAKIDVSKFEKGIYISEILYENERIINKLIID